MWLLLRVVWLLVDLEDVKKGNVGELDKADSEEVKVLRQRIKQLENSEQEWRANVSTHLKSEAALKCRIKELHLSEKNLLEEIKQLRMNLCRVETTIERVKSRLRNLQAQFAEVVQQQERAEAKHKGKLRRLQNCLRIKEDEVKRQSEYFEHCKQNQKQQITMLREREAGLQSHTGRLEKEVRDLKAAISVLSGELQEETWQCLQGEMEAAFSRVVASLPPSSSMEAAELKLLVEEAQCCIGSYVMVLKHQLQSLLSRGGSSERGTQAVEFEGGQDEGFSANQKSCSLASKLKPTEINCSVQLKMPQGRDHPLRLGWLLKEGKRKPDAAGTEDAEAEANTGLKTLFKMKWDKAIDPARSMDNQTLCLMQCAEELCIVASLSWFREHHKVIAKKLVGIFS
ncbi:UNVERIFIED_CONTAM: hypothetical protein K2H54_060293 [Gekko kuhli]